MSDSGPTTANVSTATAPASGLRATFRALKHRNFKLFFSGQIISLVGTWMQTVAEAWLIYRLTGSGALLGLLGFVGQMPIFVFSPVAGLVADRWPRRNVVIATQTSSMTLAFTLATLTLTHHIVVWEIITLATLLGVINAFDVPARQSFLIEMVGREDLLNAIALHRVDAYLRGKNSARGSFVLRHANGRSRIGSYVRCAGAGYAAAIEGIGKRPRICGDGTGRFSDALQPLALVLGFFHDSDSFRVHNDDAVYGQQHAHSGHGPGPIARAHDVPVRDDVSGNDPLWFASRRLSRRSHRRAEDRCSRRALSLI